MSIRQAPDSQAPGSFDPPDVPIPDGYMDAGSADPLARGRGFKVRKPASAHGPIEPAHCWPYHVDGSGVKKERAVIEQQLYPLVFG